MSVYEKLGVKTIINAAGPKTRLSGSIMPSAVVDAMAQASRNLAEIEYLQASASEIISKYTGAEAGIVTTGAAAGLTLAAAACVTGLDISKMDRLPDTKGMKNEVVMARDQRNAYDHAVRAIGVKVVEAGLNEAEVGVGVRSVEPWEIESAITDNTAAILFVAKPRGLPDLGEIVQVANEHHVPVIVDAAAELPPVVNLRRFTDLGASAVVYSGGKAIRGPQASGILCGKRDLIMAAVLQMLDMDNRFDTWNPPKNLIDKTRLKGIPRHGIGRGLKAGKEEIVGLLSALRIFVEKDHGNERQRYENMMKSLSSYFQDAIGISISYIPPSHDGAIPQAELKFGESYQQKDLVALVNKLHELDHPIVLDESYLNDMRLRVNPFDLQEKDLLIIADQIKRVTKELSPMVAK